MADEQIAMIQALQAQMDYDKKVSRASYRMKSTWGGDVPFEGPEQKSTAAARWAWARRTIPSTTTNPLNQVYSNFKESKSFKFDGRLDVLVVDEVF